MVLYEMLAGVRPFAAESPSGTIQRILTSEPELEALPSEVPTGVAALITGALTKNPTGRFGNGGEFLEALLACGAAASPAMHTKRGLGRLAGAAGAIVAGVALLLVALSVRSGTEPGNTGVAQAAVAAGGAHVLWVDDDPSNNAKQIGILEERGVRITTALSTAEGLERYDPAVHHVVVSDMGRPEGANREYVPRAGLELLTRLRARQPGVAVILYTTARSADRYRAEARAAGAYAVVTDTEELLRMLTAWSPTGAAVRSSRSVLAPSQLRGCFRSTPTSYCSLQVAWQLGSRRTFSASATRPDAG